MDERPLETGDGRAAPGQAGVPIRRRGPLGGAHESAGTDGARKGHRPLGEPPARAVGLQGCLWLGNLNARRDWGHARDYVEMMWLMLQQPNPVDYVIATGVQHSVREFVERAANVLDMKIVWEGSGVDERGFDQSGRCIVRVDPRYFRPSEVDNLLGDAQKAREILGWEPNITFDELVREMVISDYELAQLEERNTR